MAKTPCAFSWNAGLIWQVACRHRVEDRMWPVFLSDVLPDGAIPTSALGISVFQRYHVHRRRNLVTPLPDDVCVAGCGSTPPAIPYRSVLIPGAVGRER